MKKGVFIAILVLFTASLCWADSKTVTAASDPWPPFVDPDHPGKGVAIEIVTAAFATQGYAFSHKILPWARSEHDVKTGQIDVLPNTWFTEKRKAYLAYSKPYASNQVKFIKKKGDAFEYKGLESLAGKKVGIMRGYGYPDDFMNSKDFKRQAVGDFIINIKKLVGGRIDLTLEDEIVGKNMIAAQAPSLLDQVEFTQNALSSNDLHVTCGLTNPRHEEIIGAFNKGLETIRADGTMAKIFKSYGIE